MTGCTGIEYTELSEGLNSVSLEGKSSTDATCIGGMDKYNLARTDNPLIINGFDKFGVQMKFVREESQDCFTVHWKSGGFDYLGYLHKDILQGR